MENTWLCSLNLIHGIPATMSIRPPRGHHWPENSEETITLANGPVEYTSATMAGVEAINRRLDGSKIVFYSDKDVVIRRIVKTLPPADLFTLLRGNLPCWESRRATYWVARRESDIHGQVILYLVIDAAGKPLEVMTLVHETTWPGKDVAVLRAFTVIEQRAISRKLFGWALPRSLPRPPMAELKTMHRLFDDIIVKCLANPPLAGEDDPLISLPPVKFSVGDEATMKHLIDSVFTIAYPLENDHCKLPFSVLSGTALGPEQYLDRPYLKAPVCRSVHEAISSIYPGVPPKVERCTRFINNHLLPLLNPRGDKWKLSGPRALRLNRYGYNLGPVQYGFRPSEMNEPTAHERVSAIRFLTTWLEGNSRLEPDIIRQEINLLQDGNAT